MWWKPVIIWFALMVAAILNGTLRVKYIVPATGEGAGHVISTVLLCGLILFITWLTVKWIDPASASHARAIGALWLLMTLIFEFGVGYFIGHHTWPEMLADYKVWRGRVWVLVLITTFLAPWWMARMRGVID